MAAAAEHVEEKIEEQPEPTLREQLLEARDESIARQTEKPVEEVREERQRGPLGRFVSSNPNRRPATGEGDGERKPRGEQSEPATPAVGPTGSAAASAETGGSPSAGVVTQPVDAPQGWATHEKALWKDIPEAARAVIQRREADFHKTLTQHNQSRQVGNDFMRAATEYAPLIQARGNNPVGLFREFLGILNTIHSSDPVSRAHVMRDLSMRLGADPRALGVQATAEGQQPSPQQLPPIHPAVQQALHQAQQTSQEWREFQQRQAQEAQQREQQEMQQTAAEIESFRSRPEAKHFDAVNGLMTSLLRDGHANTLEEAYNLAVRAHPEVSKAVAAEEQAARAAEEQKQREIARKQRAGGSVRGGFGGVHEVTGSKGSVREDLVAAFESARGRV